MTNRLAPLIFASAALLAASSPAFAAHHKHHGATILAGYYQCYQTARDVSPINGGVSYSTRFTESFTLKASMKYIVGSRTAPDYRTQHVAVRGTSVRFVGGPYDSASSSIHLSGTYYAHGVKMPNSQVNPDKLYNLVLHGAAGDSDVAPPNHEGGNYSFWYCKRR